MPIVPEDKDWTWVIEASCDECGFDATAFPREQVSELIRANTQDWVALAGAHAGSFPVRPSDDRWSSLEYACHVRDVYRLYDFRLHLMLDEDDPLYPNWDQDASAVEDRYAEQPLPAVIDDLVAAGEQLAVSFEGVTDAAWQRTGIRSDGARFTVESFARYLVHDPIHHVHDVRENAARLA